MSTRKKVEFTGSDNTKLAGLLELPDSQVNACVLFAHCFTCGKDIAAASRISRALVGKGFAVMRFDFTGLGGSDGDFSNTNFSSNIEDLVLAANFLRDEYLAPALVIGHSLGGAAVLRAAQQIPECVGVSTIGAPADADHVIKQFGTDLDQISEHGEAEVDLAGRKFRIKKQFVDDANNQSSYPIAELKRALLVFHSPRDAIVSIKEAEKIYRQAKHPKSFVSLDNADHMLSNKSDADYVAETITAWASRYISKPVAEDKKPVTAVGKGEIRVTEKNHKFTQQIASDHHTWLADEPLEVGGDNLGPDPYEFLLAGLGACTSMTMRMYANRKKWPVKDIQVTLSHSRQHGEDCLHCDDDNSQVALINRVIKIEGELSEEQRARLLEIADRCPVHRTLHGKVVVETQAG